MHPHLTVVNGIDPDLTRVFLLGQDGVNGAEVWYRKGKLEANVVVDDDSELTPERVQEACATVLGDLQAPVDVTLMRARKRIA